MASLWASCDSCLNVPRKAAQRRNQHSWGKKVSLDTETLGVVQWKQYHHHPMEKSMYKSSWSLRSGTGLSRSLDFYISCKIMSSSLMVQSTAGGKQACSPGSWGGAASAEFAVSFVPPLGSLPGFLPRCWCCLWSLNVIYGKIHSGYAVWKVNIGGSDTCRSYHLFCHSLPFRLWLQKWSVLPS